MIDDNDEIDYNERINSSDPQRETTVMMKLMMMKLMMTRE
jgi:hypothetical protein